MYSVEIHTPITMNEHFSVMCYLLVKSLAENAKFPGDWKIVFSVSRDSDLTEESPQFAWAKSYPVEFQLVDQELWDRMGYAGTGTQCVISAHEADVVLYMDADIVVAGPLDDITRRISESNAIFGWPAWFSGDLPFDELFRAAGIDSPVRFEIKLTDEGADFTDPGWPCYFNFGFIGVSKALANDMRQTFPIDQQFVMDHFENYFAGQVGLALNIVRNRYPWVAIDERYNAGSDHPLALEHYREKLGRPMFPSTVATEDPRVLHYCFPTPTLRKKRDMESWHALQQFLARPDLAGFERRLQESIRSLDLCADDDAYHRNLAWIELERRYSDLENRCLRQDEIIQRLKKERDEWRSDAKAVQSALRRQSIEQEQRLEKALMRIHALENSLSWRITMPLRRVSRKLFERKSKSDS